MKEARREIGFRRVAGYRDKEGGDLRKAIIRVRMPRKRGKGFGVGKGEEKKKRDAGEKRLCGGIVCHRKKGLRRGGEGPGGHLLAKEMVQEGFMRPQEEGKGKVNERSIVRGESSTQTLCLRKGGGKYL